MEKKTVSLSTPDGEMKAYLALPEKIEGAAAVIALQEAFGVNSYIKNVCEQFAAQGYIAIAPELYHRSEDGLVCAYDDLSKVKPIFADITNDKMEMDMTAALDYLIKQQGVPRNKVAVIGFCMGGFAAFLGACRLDIGTALSFYGGGIVNPRPHIGLTPPLGEAANIRMPVICFFGGKDTHIPPSDVDAIRAAFAKQPQLGHEIYVYPDADHGFMCNERASYHEESARDAWQKVWAWLDKTIMS